MLKKKNKKCIIISAGECPKKKIFSHFRNKLNYSAIFCADGGFANARKLGIVPDYIIGDMDSIEIDELPFATESTTTILIARQSDTDTEKCLKFAIARKYTHILLMGADGGRLDHLISVLGLLLKYTDKVSIAFISNSSIIHPVFHSIELETEKDEIISCFSIDERAEFQSKGLKYPLKGTGFLLGKKESISNFATGSMVSISSGSGKFLLVRSIDSALRESNFYEH